MKAQSSRGELEAKISEATIKFEREFMGRGPTEVRTFLIEDMILIRLKGIITRAENHLATADPTGRGRELVKQSRMELLEKAKPVLVEQIEKTVGVSVVSMHTDISVKTGERIILFTMASRLA